MGSGTVPWPSDSSVSHAPGSGRSAKPASQDAVPGRLPTVNRQVSKLESLGPVRSEPGATDRRIRHMTITPQGQVMTDAVDAARERLGRAIFKDWPAAEVETLIDMMGRFADGLEKAVRP